MGAIDSLLTYILAHCVWIKVRDLEANGRRHGGTRPPTAAASVVSSSMDVRELSNLKQVVLLCCVSHCGSVAVSIIVSLAVSHGHCLSTVSVMSAQDSVRGRTTIDSLLTEFLPVGCPRFQDLLFSC